MQVRSSKHSAESERNRGRRPQKTIDTRSRQRPTGRVRRMTQRHRSRTSMLVPSGARPSVPHPDGRRRLPPAACHRRISVLALEYAHEAVSARASMAHDKDGDAGAIVAYVLAMVYVAAFVIWYLFRVRFWYRTSKCVSFYSCICGWLCCCWRHEIRRPPHTGLFAGTGRKSRATHVALCFPHNPVFPCFPTGCSCDLCCDDSAESRAERRHEWDPEAHPWGLGCALPCWPRCCIQCLCEDQVHPDLAPAPHSASPAHNPDRRPGCEMARTDFAAAPPPAYEEVAMARFPACFIEIEQVVQSDSQQQRGGVADWPVQQQLPPPPPLQQEQLEHDVSPAEAARVLARFAVKGASTMVSTIALTAKKAAGASRPPNASADSASIPAGNRTNKTRS